MTMEIGHDEFIDRIDAAKKRMHQTNVDALIAYSAHGQFLQATLFASPIKHRPKEVADLEQSPHNRRRQSRQSRDRIPRSLSRTHGNRRC